MPKTPELPNLQEYDDAWTYEDQADLFFLLQKYTHARPPEGEDHEWMKLRKIAEKNKLREDGSPNPHYARLALEAVVSRQEYEIGLMMRSIGVLFNLLPMQETLFNRMAMVEGAYSYLRMTTDNVKGKYQESMRQHTVDRREFRTVEGMRKAGLDPDSNADRLRWAEKLDELTAQAFGEKPKPKEPTNE